MSDEQTSGIPPAIVGDPSPSPEQYSAWRIGDGWWWGDEKGDSHGPCDPKEMSAAIAGGQVNAGTLVWREGQESWKPARDVPELAPHVMSATPGTTQEFLRRSRRTAGGAGLAALNLAERLKGHFKSLEPKGKRRMFIVLCAAVAVYLLFCAGPFSTPKGPPYAGLIARIDGIDAELRESTIERHGENPSEWPIGEDMRLLSSVMERADAEVRGRRRPDVEVVEGTGASISGADVDTARFMVTGNGPAIVVTVAFQSDVPLSRRARGRAVIYRLLGEEGQDLGRGQLPLRSDVTAGGLGQGDIYLTGDDIENVERIELKLVDGR